MVHSRRSDLSLGLMGHSQEVNCLDSKNGLIISGSRDQTARIWTLTSSSPLATIPMFDRVWSVAISPTQRNYEEEVETVTMAQVTKVVESSMQSRNMEWWGFVLQWNLLHALETVLGDPANLRAMARIDVPSWWSWTNLATFAGSGITSCYQ
ncbi:hypothetical protein CHARACLAT_032062 [Characodon lateralis]|uniref:Uncharacterized protein n=1 Tax=Characodon lateralis TaxID=208331 RepID=A0ABU7DFZ2_9TELE|nr:hypothetical protein [Characodon lateralis]